MATGTRYLVQRLVDSADIEPGGITSSNVGLQSTSYTDVSTPVTTTSTTAYTSVASASFTPLKTGKVRITAVLYASNNTAGDGVSCQVLVGTTAYYTYSLISSAANQVQVYYAVVFLTGQATGTPLSIASQIEAVTGGTASATGTLLIEELLQ